jgi:Uma2 family endonuclease
MVSMSTVSSGTVMTAAEFERLREVDDGLRYELIDGVLYVSPAPAWVHQRVVMRLARLLEDALPPGWEVLGAPFDVRLGLDTITQPDVVIASLDDYTPRGLVVPPVLAVEILSPSTRSVDLRVKFVRHLRAGTPHYWIVDPDEPSLTAWQLRGGTYLQVAHGRGEEEVSLVAPVVVRVRPVDLVSP